VEKRRCHILFIEDNPGDVRLLQEYLAKSSSPVFTMETAERLAPGLERLERGGIDLAVVDLNLPDAAGLSAFVAVRQAAPKVPVILLTGHDDEELAVQAVREGAQDYLVKGKVKPSSVRRAIRHALARHQAEAARARREGGKVVAFIGAKGGVGTTTVALNVAAALVREQGSAILAEVRATAGALSLLLGFEGSRNLASLLKTESAGITAAGIQAHLTRLPNGLRVLFGPALGQDMPEIHADQARGLVAGLRRTAENVLVELPCGGCASNREVAQACDFVALVVEPEPLCAQIGKAVANMLMSWGVSLANLGVVVVNRGVWGNPMSVREVHSAMNCEVIAVIPPGPEAIRSALQMGVPVVLLQEDSNAAVALRDLTSRLFPKET
jgi:MinD-like ATPase involved in chromosome partitioning or flagellar assembly/CheY-like chemotaxis protein